MAKRDSQLLLTCADAARILGVSADVVRAMSDDGRLPCMRTVGGTRLFLQSDVDRVKQLLSTRQP